MLLEVNSSLHGPNHLFGAPYLHMLHGLLARQERELSTEELRLLESQDENYVNMKLQQERKVIDIISVELVHSFICVSLFSCCTIQRIEKLGAELHFLGVPAENKHIVFADSLAEAKQFSPTEYFGTPNEFLNRSFNRPRADQLGKNVLGVDAKNTETDIKMLERYWWFKIYFHVSLKTICYCCCYCRGS